MKATATWSLLCPLLLIFLMVGCGKQVETPSAAGPPGPSLIESRGRAHARIWRLVWGGEKDVAGTWVVTGQHMQVSLRLHGEGGAWSLHDHAGELAKEIEFTWETPLEPAEELCIVRDGALFGIARRGRTVESNAFVQDTWNDDYWVLSPGTTTQVRGQRLGPVVFADDFAHAEGDFGEWKPEGEWSVETVRNPLRSANAFCLVGCRASAALTTGQWSWRNYQFAVSVRCHDGDSFSLLAYRSDEGTHYELAVTRKESTTELRLLRHVGAKADVLANATLPPLESWNRLAVSVHEDVIAATVNEKTVLRAIDPMPLVAGGVELRLDKVVDGGVEFDDASIMPVTSSRLSPDSTSRLVEAEEGCLTVLSPRLRDCVTELDLASLSNSELDGLKILSRLTPDGGGVGLALARDAKGDLSVQLQEMRGDGSPVRIGHAAFPADIVGKILRLHVRGREAWASLDGHVLCSGEVSRAMSPGITQFVLPDSVSRLSPKLHLAPNPAPKELLVLHHAFASERSMENWTDEASEWQECATTGSTKSVWMHRSDFWADFKVDLPLVGPGGITDFLLCRDTDTAESPFLALMARGGNLVLETEGKRREIACGLPVRMECERRQDQLIVRCAGRVVHAAPMPTGSFWRVALRTELLPREWLPLVSIGAGSLRDYAFTKAPVDWVPASGRWAVTNRWQCDPRWSFYTGRNLVGPAVNWFRLHHADNLTLEFFAGPRMNRESGDAYDYARDINATIGAVHGDLDSGYSFYFGGNANSGSQIMLGKETLCDNPSVRIPDEKILVHRHWFYVKIRKQGKHLVWWVDGAKAGEVDVASAPGGNQLAIWTRRNQIAVARVRVSSESLDPSPRPHPPSGHLAARSPEAGLEEPKEARQ